MPQNDAGGVDTSIYKNIKEYNAIDSASQAASSADLTNKVKAAMDQTKSKSPESVNPLPYNGSGSNALHQLGAGAPYGASQ